MAISAPGIGSGLDVNSIVSQLVALERQPIDKLRKDATSIQTKISAYGQVSSLVSAVESAADKLAQTSLWTGTSPKSSEPDILTVASSTQAASPGTYQVEVNRLAQPHVVRAGPMASTTTALGSDGTLKLAVGNGTAVDVAFTAADTLETLRDAINAAGAGLSANVVTGSIGGVSGAYLMLRSDTTGAAQTISTAGSTGLPAELATFTQNQAAQDAEIVVDGVTITAATNTVTDAPTGVTLSLNALTTSPVKVTVTADKAGQRKAIDDFVAAYNALDKYLADQTRYDEATKAAGTLQGDSGALAVRNQLRNAVRGTSTGSSVFQSLGALGFSLDAKGALTVKSSTLDSALSRPAELARLFGTVTAEGSPTRGLALQIRDTADALTDTEGVVTHRADGLRSRLKRNQDDQARIEDRVERTRKRLLQYYGNLDTRMGSLNGLSTYMTQQLAAFNRSNL